ncbi:hypothetical protein [Xanthomonas cannabis]|uniref:hypothetical protein n=1 Tax=Xanthomonas cannabis TaxID=1885674 RepID=UPI001112AAFC|nr:hypothetical protein [Xanthomonas cannabis]
MRITQSAAAIRAAITHASACLSNGLPHHRAVAAVTLVGRLTRHIAARLVLSTAMCCTTAVIYGLAAVMQHRTRIEA